MSLPTGYTQLEYIEGSGSQYIDTELACNKSDSWRYSIVADLVNNSNYAGCNGYLQYQASVGGGVKSNIDIVYQNVTETISVDGVQKSSQSWAGYSGSNVKIGILKMGDANNTWFSSSPQSGKIYSCKIYKSGVLTRDFVPCKNPSGSIGLYDLVGAQFYQNSGTGIFIAGAVVNFGGIFVKVNGVWKQIDNVTVNVR